MRRYIKIKLLGLCLLVAVVGLGSFVHFSPQANYVWRAYFYPGGHATLRGYPIVDPPDAYNGTWTHYAFSGRPLAILRYANGDIRGKQIYLKDDGQPYLVRHLNDQGWERDEVCLDPPPNTIIPWYFPQRWVNRSLDRLAILDKLFPEQPVVIISEGREEQEGTNEVGKK